MFFLIIDPDNARAEKAKQMINGQGFDCHKIIPGQKDLRTLLEEVRQFLNPPDRNNFAVLLVQAAWSERCKEELRTDNWTGANGVLFVLELCNQPMPAIRVFTFVLWDSFVPNCIFPIGWTIPQSVNGTDLTRPASDMIVTYGRR